MIAFRAVRRLAGSTWLLVLSGAGLPAGAGPLDPTPRTLHVACAASLRAPIEAGFDAFRPRMPGWQIRLTSGASAVLAQQARLGAPLDLLIAAAPDEIDRLADEGRARRASRRTLAGDRLILVVPRGETPPRTVAELIDPGYDPVAVANPRTAPLGRYTRQGLRTLELWERLTPRLVLGESARHVVDFVARGEAAVGVVYRTQAEAFAERLTPGPALPESTHDPVVYVGVVLADAAEPDGAGAFLDWLAGPNGRRLFLERGYLAPPDAD